jgi:hypothetical protein
MGAKLLPPFDEFGYSPPGIHACRVEELVARFGSGSPEREVETQELIDFFAWARRVGFERVIVNGSYVTSKAAPNDVDVVFLPAADYPRSESPYGQNESRWPFLQVLVAVDAMDLEQWSLKDFGTDRDRRQKRGG